MRVVNVRLSSQETTMPLSTYFRWSRSRLSPSDTAMTADILGSDTIIMACPEPGTIVCETPDRPLSPNEARMIGVRLIEAAALADNGRSIRG